MQTGDAIICIARFLPYAVQPRLIKMCGADRKAMPDCRNSAYSKGHSDDCREFGIDIIALHFSCCILHHFASF